MASRGGGNSGQMMVEHRMHQRRQSNIDRPVVGKTQVQPNMTRKGSQPNVRHVVQKSLPSSRNESSGRGKVDKIAPSGSVMASGNQVMLLRQKRTMNGTTQNAKISQLQKQPSLRQTLEQENIGGISMLEVMQNLRMLEQQQIEARRKLLESRQVKGKEIEVQKKQLLLLEGKKFSNGQARGELDKYRDFLSFASRKMGDRKVSSSNLDRNINDFHRHLDGGIQSCKLIKVTGCMVDSILEVIERKVHSLGLIKDKSSKTLKNEIDKYERAKDWEQHLRSSIHSSQADAQKWAEQNKIMSDEVAKLEIDKSDVQVKEEETEKELRDICDEIKAEEERFVQVKDAYSREMEESERQLTILLEEVVAFESTLHSDEAAYESEKTELFDSIKQEGWNFENDGTEAYKAAIHMEEANIQRLVESQMNDLMKLEQEVKEMDEVLKLVEMSTRERDEESHTIHLQVDSIKAAEARRMAAAADVEKQLASDRAEIESFERSLRAIEEVHRSEAEKNALTDCDMAAEQSELSKQLKMLLEEMTTCDQKSKADATHWEQIEMPSLQGRILRAKEQANQAEDSYHELDLGEFPEKIDETEDFNDRIIDLMHRHPELTEIDTRYDPRMPFHQQLHTALRDLKAKCEQIRSAELKNQLKVNHPTNKYKTKTFQFYRPQNYAIEAKDTDFSEQDIEPIVLQFEEAMPDPKESRKAITSDAHWQVLTTTNRQVRFQDDHFVGYDQQKPLSVSEKNSDEDVPHEGRHIQVNWDEEVEKERNIESKEKSVQHQSNDPYRTLREATKVAKESSEKSRRRSRKKINSSFLRDSKGSLNGQRTNKNHGSSVLELISQKDAGQEPTRKRKISLASCVSHKSKDTKNGDNANDNDRHKRRKAKLDTEKITKDTSKSKKCHFASGQGNENEYQDKKSTKECDNGCSDKLTELCAVVEMGEKTQKSSKKSDVNRRQDNPSKSVVERDAHVHKQQKDRHERRREDLSSKHFEAKSKCSRNGNVAIQEQRTASRGILKVPEKCHDHQKRMREKIDSSLPKKDEPRKSIIKTKSSFRISKGDDVSNGSKLSKPRRSRKKSGRSQMFQKSDGMDYDFGFKF